MRLESGESQFWKTRTRSRASRLAVNDAAAVLRRERGPEGRGVVGRARSGNPKCDVSESGHISRN